MGTRVVNRVQEAAAILPLPPGHVTSKEEWSLRKQLTCHCTCKDWQATACLCKGYCACHYQEKIGNTQVHFDANCLESAIYDTNQPALLYTRERWKEVAHVRVVLPVFENIPEGTLSQGIEEYQKRFSTPPAIALICAVHIGMEAHIRRKWPRALAFGLLLNAPYRFP